MSIGLYYYIIHHINILNILNSNIIVLRKFKWCKDNGESGLIVRSNVFLYNMSIMGLLSMWLNSLMFLCSPTVLIKATGKFHERE